MGDINIDLLNGHNTRWPNLTKSFGLSQLIDEPTRVTLETSTLLDHVLVSDIHFVQEYSCLFKGDMTRYLLMSMNLGIWNIKHDFI